MVYRKNGIWYIRGKIKDYEGNYKYYNRKTDAKTKSEAMECERQFRLTFQLKEEVREQLTFEDIANEYLNDYKSKIKQSSLKAYRDTLKLICPILGSYKIGLLNKKILQTTIDSFDEKYSKSYVEKIYYLIRNIFKYAIDQGMIESNPMNRVHYDLRKNEIKKEMNFYEPDEFEIFIKYVDDDYKSFFMFLYYMGTRKSEALALNWTDIDFDNKTVQINKTMTKIQINGEWLITSPKTSNSIRIISMPMIIFNMLKEMKNEQQKYYGFNENCFVFGMIKPLARQTIRKKNKKAVKKANEDGHNLKEIRIHDFRHSHVSYLINNKSNRYNDYDIAQRLGDTIATIQKTYAHMFKDSAKKISDFIDEDTLNKEDQKQTRNIKNSNNDISSFEKMVKLKELLDMGILTTEEFDKKKQELLMDI